jgi:6-phosphogluconolactonase (cycloisomerase 2 family)
MFSSKVESFSIDPTSGNLTFVGIQPTGSDPEGIVVDPSGRFVYAATIGGIYAYTISNTGVLAQISGSPFTDNGFPNGIVVDPSERFLYAANVSTSDVSAFGIDYNTGILTPLISSPFPAGSGPRSMALDDSGSFAYVADTLNDTLSAYTIDPASGALTANPAGLFTAGRNVYWVTTTANIH